MNSLSRLLRLPTNRRHLLVEAVLRLVIARMQTSTLPFRHLSPSLDSAARDSANTLPEHQESTASDIGWAIDCAAKHLPLKLLCLQQAIAAKRMLTHRGIPGTLYLGTRRSADNSLIAHAWLHSGAVEVTGGDSQLYTVLSRYS